MSVRGLLRVVAPTVLGVLCVAAMPATSFASCIPPQFHAFAGGTDTVVLEGAIVAVEPTRVIVDAARWWGNEPRQRVAIQRTPADPTVITSVDWNPQPGERWVIVAKRDGNALATGVCEQLPTDPSVLTEVRSSLGEGVVPQPAAESASDAGWSPILLAGLLAIGLVVLVGLRLARRRATPS